MRILKLNIHIEVKKSASLIKIHKVILGPHSVNTLSNY